MSARVLNDPPLSTCCTDLHRELAPAVLEKCRELVAEYAALAKADPAAFPFTEHDLLAWYGDMKAYLEHAFAKKPERFAARPGSKMRRVRQTAVAA